MGVCYLQHRITTGLFSSKFANSRDVLAGTCSSPGLMNDLGWKTSILRFVYLSIIAIYALLLLSIIFVANSLDCGDNEHHCAYKTNFLRKSTLGNEPNNRQLLSCWTITILFYLLRNTKKISKLKISQCGWPTGKNCPNKFFKTSIFVSFWLTALNRVLIFMVIVTLALPILHLFLIQFFSSSIPNYCIFFEKILI